MLMLKELGIMEVKMRRNSKVFIAALALTLTLALLMTTTFTSSSIAEGGEGRATTWLTFTWVPVTVNANNTPCTDLAGYTIYRSRSNESADWKEITGIEKAYQVIPATITENKDKYSCWCLEGGTWYFMIRAFDTTKQFSSRSNIISCFVDVTMPGAVIDFQAVTPGDINNDGSVDGKDLSIMSMNFGSGKEKGEYESN